MKKIKLYYRANFNPFTLVSWTGDKIHETYESAEAEAEEFAEEHPKFGIQVSEALPLLTDIKQLKQIIKNNK